MRNLSTLLLVLIASLFITSTAFAESAEYPVLTAPITKVTVLPNRAEVIRNGEIGLKAGLNTILVKDFESTASLGTLRAKVTGAGQPILNAINIKSVPVPFSKIDEYKKLIDERVALEDSIKALKDQALVSSYKLSLVKKLLDNSKKVFSLKLSLGGADIASLQKKVEFYTAQEALCRTKQNELKKMMDKLNFQHARLDKKIKELYGMQRKRETAVFVELDASVAGKAQIELKYFVSGCSWRPTYELNYDSVQKKMNVEYSASISQRTGKVWKDVELTLSTTTPSITIAPEPHTPWDVSFYVPRPVEVAKVMEKSRRLSENLVSTTRSTNTYGGDLEEAEAEEDSINGYAAISSSSRAIASGLAVSFKIPDPTTVSYGTSHKLLIGTFALDTELSNFSAPRVDPRVYIKTKSKNTSSFPMLPGYAKCFIDGAFTAISIVDRVDLNGELTVPLGFENRLKVKRSVVSDSVDEKGSKLRHEYHYRIEITNNAGKEMDAVIKDLLPFSQHDDLDVKVTDISVKPTERSDEEILTWKLKLAPGQKIVIDIEYYIQYPEEMIPVYE